MAENDAETARLPLVGHNIDARKAWNLRGSFGYPVAALAVGLLAAFAAIVEWDPVAATDAHVQRYYTWFIHVSVMIFLGFGFLMTFLKRYSNSAVALNFFTSCMVLALYIVVGGAFNQMLISGRSSVRLSMPLLIDSLFMAGAAMISFGAVLGRLTPSQITWLLALEVPFYVVNQWLAFDVFRALDIGGSITIHMFGAVFGLSAALLLPKAPLGAPKNEASWNSDMSAMIGTIILWIYWPSFVGALASSADPGSSQQFHCVANTLLALVGSCIAAFAADAVLDNNFDAVHIQNATLAGGVAVGSMANLEIAPFGALLLGMVAGAWSVWGYEHVSPFLVEKVGLQDTCGVINLHGMPGLLGGAAAGVAGWWAYHPNKHLINDGRSLPLWQLVAVSVTLGIAGLGGALSGLVVSKCNFCHQQLQADMFYEDGVFWAGKEVDESSGGD